METNQIMILANLKSVEFQRINDMNFCPSKKAFIYY